MTAPVAADPAAAYYTAQAATAAVVADELTDIMTGADWTGGVEDAWGRVRQLILSAIIFGQLRSASIPGLYVNRILRDAGLEPDPIAAVPPTAFAGRSAGGWSMGQAVDTVPRNMRSRLAFGAAPADVVAAAVRDLTMLAATEVADAGRGAMEAAMRLEPQIVGYERYVNLPACSRCIILAGRVYRYSEGFRRHPKCDCSHRPLTSREARDGTEQESSEMFRSLTREEQDRIFTKDGARAIRAGADLSQVVNARKGMSVPGDPFTTVGRGRRRRGQKTTARLSPQGIAREAGDDDQRYLELLRQFRYI